MKEPTHIDQAGEKNLRSDAVHNRARIVDAARELFSERGIDAPMNAIARRAGVGVATLFRRFPDRQSLVAEVFSEQIEQCESVLDEAVRDADPWRGFCGLIEHICMMQIDDRGFTEAFLSSFADNNDYQDKRSHAESAFEELVRRAQQSGDLRPDFATSDLVMFLLANGGLRSAPPDHAHELSRRLVAYLIQAFGTGTSRTDHPLPAPSRLGLHHVIAPAEPA